MTTYFNYCLNESCSNHRGLAGWSDREPEQGTPRRCPLCGSGVSYTESDDPVFQLPELLITGSPTGVVLDRMPYGGFMLEFDDDDASKTYGGTEHADDGGGHIAELKHDLMLLGYYGALRFRTVEREARGRFHIHVVGALIAFKHDLINEYGVASETSPAAPEVAEDAEITLDAVGPIQFDRSLSSPYLDGFASIHVKLVGQRERQGLMRSFSRTRARWDGGQGWYDQNELRRSRQHSEASPYIQADVRSRSRALLVDTRAERIRQRSPHSGADLEAVLHRIIETECLSAVPGEPDEVELGEPVEAQGLEHIAQIEVVLGELLAGFNEVCEAIGRWDQGSSGQAGTLRAELGRLEGVEGLGRADRRQRDSSRSRLDNWDHFREEWDRVHSRARVMVARVRAYLRDNMARFRAYRDGLVHASTVDISTAVHIKHMLLHRELPYRGRTRGVFVCPTNDEIQELREGETLEQVVRESAERNDVPYPIIAESIQHESGARQANRVGRLRLPVYGVDWDNVGRRHAFSEVLTKSSARWKWSIGWGATQFTSFSDEADGFDHVAGIPVTREASPPMPPYISSIHGNLDIGVRLLRGKFDHTAFDRHNPRDCTFSTRFDCNRCLQPARYGVETLNELMALFKPVLRNGSAARHARHYAYYIDLDAARFQAVFNHTLEHPEQHGEKIDWPCSWLTAKMHYGGTGPQAWAGLQRTIRALARAGGATNTGDEEQTDAGAGEGEGESGTPH